MNHSPAVATLVSKASAVAASYHVCQRFDGHECNLCDLRAALSAVEGERGGGDAGWVATSERLPPQLTDILAVWWQGEACIAYLRNTDWWYKGNYGVKPANIPPTHWMFIPAVPLPAPPALADGGAT